VNPDVVPFPAVELRQVNKRFGERVILDRIDLQIARGEILVLVGKSGSGKSTLLKIVSGIETPDSGRVFLAGGDCTEKPPYRRAVHTVFQSYALFPHLDVLQNVAFPLSIAGVTRMECRRRAAEALDWVQLAEHAQRRVESLSGGERQRVALARALVNAPECVLLDEPLSALDPHLRAETLELLQGIQSRLRTTFLFITHDREEALRLGHRIGVLNQGRLEQVGTPREVYERPRTAFVASFLGRMNWMPANVTAAGGLVIAGQVVSCPLSFVLCQLSVGGKEGRVRVGVRPEDLRIEACGTAGQASSGAQRLRATVAGCQFLGDCVHIRLALADGTQVVVDQRSSAEGLAPGKEVGLLWEREAVHVFGEE
jgi:spermidine/putrescine transport system ATP-binding protein